MLTAFDNVAVLHYKYNVGVSDGGETVGDDEACLVFHQFKHSFAYDLLGTGINVGGCFVQYQYGALGKHCSGDGKELLLTLGDIGTVVGQYRVVAIGQAGDEIMYLCRLCQSRGLTLLLCGGLVGLVALIALITLIILKILLILIFTTVRLYILVLK